MTAKQLEDIHNFKQEGDESLYQTWERYNDLIYMCPTHDINSHQKVNIFYKGLSTMNRQLLDSQRPILKVRLAEALTTIQTMADHSQHEKQGKCSCNPGWMPNLQRTSPRQGLSPQRGRPPGYYTKIDNRPPYAERMQSLEEFLTKHQEESAQKSTKMEEIYEEAKVVTIENKGPSSPKKLKNLHGISFLSDSQEENTIDQLPMKESNTGNIFEYLGSRNLSETEMLVEMADMRKKAPLGILKDILVWWLSVKVPVWGAKGQVLEEIWIKCKRSRSKDIDWWYDYWYEDEEKIELGNEDYNPPIVHTKTFEVTKYKFNNGCSFICASGKSNETLSLGRKNGSRFRKMIMEEMEETLKDDGEVYMKLEVSNTEELPRTRHNVATIRSNIMEEVLYEGEMM
ncbi:hypothetical protein Tco_1295676 [Tanacetum coccineum]